MYIASLRGFAVNDDQVSLVELAHPGRVRMPPPAAMWSCLVCTLDNPESVSMCSVCNTPRIVAPVGQVPCPRCTLLNDASVDRCVACGLPRDIENEEAEEEPELFQRAQPQPQSGAEERQQREMEARVLEVREREARARAQQEREHREEKEARRREEREERERREMERLQSLTSSSARTQPQQQPQQQQQQHQQQQHQQQQQQPSPVVMHTQSSQYTPQPTAVQAAASSALPLYQSVTYQQANGTSSLPDFQYSTTTFSSSSSTTFPPPTLPPPVQQQLPTQPAPAYVPQPIQRPSSSLNGITPYQPSTSYQPAYQEPYFRSVASELQFRQDLGFNVVTELQNAKEQIIKLQEQIANLQNARNGRQNHREEAEPVTSQRSYNGGASGDNGNYSSSGWGESNNNNSNNERPRRAPINNNNNFDDNHHNDNNGRRCYAFQEGNCHRGATCKFSHDQAPTPWVIPEADPYNKDDYIFNHSKSTTGIDFDKYEDVEVTVLGTPTPPSPQATFASMNLPHLLFENVQKCGYLKPTPIQKHAIPSGLAGRDIMATAQTGSGKTVAYLLPLLVSCLRRSPGSRWTHALVVAPTRELSLQIFEQGRKLAYGTPVVCVAIYGGAPKKDQLTNLEHVGRDVVIGTPGRIHDFLQSQDLKFDKTKFLVLDEADRMLDMGFAKDIKALVEEINRERQILLFSATFPPEVRGLAKGLLQRDFVQIAIGMIGSSPGLIAQKLCQVTERGKDRELHKLLKGNEGKGLALVFAERKHDVAHLGDRLRKSGLAAVEIHGDLDQQQRERALRIFTSKSTPNAILVATDVAARGLDIGNISLVVNYDLPRNIDSYVHRIGRTGRCGNHGLAVSFVTGDEGQMLRDVVKHLQHTNQEVPEWLVDLTREARAARGLYAQTTFRAKDNHEYSSSSNNNNNSACRAFARGDCSKGASCRYLHDRGSSASSSSSSWTPRHNNNDDDNNHSSANQQEAATWGGSGWSAPATSSGGEAGFNADGGWA